MGRRSDFLAILPLAALAASTPVDLKHQARQVFDPFNPCKSCFRSSWTQGPECTANSIIRSTLSRVTNPPASATATYTPTKWCTDFLRQTDWSTSYTTSFGVSTHTDWTITHLFITVTDTEHPTSTMYCPIPSQGMVCGVDSNTIAPIDQGEDWSIEHYYNPEECQQVCLDHPLCKAYRVDGSPQSGWNCEIFNVGLGVNASHVINPTIPGTQWWDRNCQQHIPGPCRARAVRTAAPIQIEGDVEPTAPAENPAVPTPAEPLITPEPTLVPRADIVKRSAELPDYMSDLSYFWSYVYLTPACSCLITSALPPVPSTTTSTVTRWTSSTTVSTTYEDWFRVTVTPRETTIYMSIN
ncbi:hypothetical protein CC78DRAFT_567339 [Lojkania enalia]|uniref:Apple domain-containing protein n=1 Tax=Lojkania enalia TaxID=147567 RepID=A0A9P4KAN5_9PLEO|nr:hypothetical protein CC78DRAFT_567339 [Didymosphaeria enalia]